MKKITLAVILTLLVNIFCLPLWTECDYVGFVRTLFNKEVRLDLRYTGKITSAEPFLYRVTPKPFYATWVYETGRHDITKTDLALRRLNREGVTMLSWDQ